MAGLELSKLRKIEFIGKGQKFLNFFLYF